MPEANAIPLHLDWSFWAALVAALALILSQLPPLHLLLRRARLDMEIHSRIHISHKVGNPNIQAHLILTNNGGRRVRIKDIHLKLTREKKEISALPAQTYLQLPADTTPVLFTSFSLKPLDEWAHIVNFLNYFSRSDEKRYRGAESRLRNDIVEKRKLLGNNDLLVEAESGLVSPFIEIFDEKFVWIPGEYEMVVTVVTTKSSIEKKYRFTLFESDSAALFKVKDVYKFGDGINWDSGEYAGAFVQLAEG